MKENPVFIPGGMLSWLCIATFWSGQVHPKFFKRHWVKTELGLNTLSF